MSAPASEPEPTRWELIRDVAVFQVKLALDALRDLLLSPVSIAAALAGLVFRRDRPGVFFYELLALGRRSEHFIDLFMVRRRPDPEAEAETGVNVDAIVERMQETLVEQYRRGGVTASAKHQIDRVLDRVERKTPARIGPPPEADPRGGSD